MLVPSGNGIVGYTGGKENSLPKLLYSLGSRLVGEHLLSPSGTGNCGNTPLILVVHLLSEGLDDLVASLSSLGYLCLIDALETVGVLGLKIDANGKGVCSVLELCNLPFLHLGKGCKCAFLLVELYHRLVAPLHPDLTSATAVALLGNHFCEFRLVKIGKNNNVLTLADVSALLCNQSCIFSENSLFHE